MRQRKREAAEAERRRRQSVERRVIDYEESLRQARRALAPAFPPPLPDAVVSVRCSHMGYSARVGTEGALYVRGSYVHTATDFSVDVMKIAGTLVNEARERGEL